MQITTLKEKIFAANEYLKNKVQLKPTIGIILGTGLNGLANEIDIICSIDYGEIPCFPISTIESHSGKLLFGTLSGKLVVVMQDRFHYYEGYSMAEITFPIRVMKQLGMQTLIISNAAGSLNPLFKKGDLMLIDDYINLLGTTPLVGEYDPSFGSKFPDMSEPYSQRLISIMENIALKEQIQIRKGVYAAMCGPCLETRAEYRMLKLIGADAIGMSTIPETIVAKQIGVETFGISILTDECYPDCLIPVTLEDIIDVSNSAEPKMTMLIKELIKMI
jgi:purine-nucleoside phosphorylase